MAAFWETETADSGSKVSLSCFAVGHTGIVAVNDSDDVSTFSFNSPIGAGFCAGDALTVVADDPIIGLTVRTNSGIIDVPWHIAEKIHVIPKTTD